MHILWYLVVDVVIGLILAGAVAPLVLALLPPHVRGSWILGGIAIGCVLVVSFVRQFAIEPGRRKEQEER
jgi:hypothetical protein